MLLRQLQITRLLNHEDNEEVTNAIESMTN